MRSRWIRSASAAHGSRRLPLARLFLEQLETRTLLSAYTPAQIVHGYQFDKAGFNGAGQTIGIVDAYDNPNIAADLAVFNSRYGLPSATLTKVNQTGGSTLPVVNSHWDTEIALDVEWAHAVAPSASILLVEASSNRLSDLMTAVDYAAGHAGVVSISWGTGEFAGETGSLFDGHFGSHPGVTFVAASGDYGRPLWPAVSSDVVAVGGTALVLTSSGTWSGETAWGGSGGGVSLYESQPAYQKGVVTQSSSKRTSPDVSYVADPSTGISVYDSNNGGWVAVGGTSVGAPQWAGLIALADQGRVAGGLAPLATAQALSAIYAMPSSNFHDVTIGGNGSASAGVGYDLVTGRGSPIADRVVHSLITGGTPTVVKLPNPGQPVPASAPTQAGTGGTSGNNSGAGRKAAPTFAAVQAPAFAALATNSRLALTPITPTVAVSPAPAARQATTLAPFASPAIGGTVRVDSVPDWRVVPISPDVDDGDAAPPPATVPDGEAMPDAAPVEDQDTQTTAPARNGQGTGGLAAREFVTAGPAARPVEADDAGQNLVRVSGSTTELAALGVMLSGFWYYGGRRNEEKKERRNLC